MSILLASTTSAGPSDPTTIRGSANLVATNGIGIAEACPIEIKTETDGWTPLVEVLSAETPVQNVIGPATIRIVKPISASPFAIEIIRDIPGDL